VGRAGLAWNLEIDNAVTEYIPTPTEEMIGISLEGGMVCKTRKFKEIY